MVCLECAIWELPNLLYFEKFSFCVRWMSQVQGFGFSKRLTRKRHVLSILFRNLRFTRTDFSRIASPKSEQDLHH